MTAAVQPSMENKKYRLRYISILPFLVGAVLVSGCSTDSAQSMNIMGGTVTPSPEIQVTIAGTSTPVIVNTIPTPTVIPTVKPGTEGLVTRVNGQPITLQQFNAEMARYLAGDPAAPSPGSPEGKQLASQLKDIVLATLIDRALIAQEATRNKITVTDKEIDDEIANFVDMRGGQDRFNQWLDSNKQTEQDLRGTVRNELLASIMRDHIVEQLPRTAEYVHAYHIVLATEAAAQNTLAQLKTGAKFTTLAQTQSIDASTKADGGDLGWFTRGAGVVLWSEVEDAAFAVKAGQISPIIHSPIGYHVIKVVERQTRALTPNDTAYIQQTTIEQWINRLRTNAKIEKFI
jgi:parvulin-like peptidyl-prolyl isomerase